MDKTLKTSIILLNWNGKEDTIKCLESLKTLNYPNYETIVVDNASSDDSVKIISDKFPNVTLITNKENLGFAEGSNIGIRYALEGGADYVFLLNNDAIIDEETVTELVQVAESDDKIGIIGSRICCYDRPDRIQSAGAHIGIKTGRVWYPDYGKSITTTDGKAVDVDAVSGTAMMVKREVIEKVGMLDPTFFCYFEDTDWCIRARKTGYRVVIVPMSKIWHKGGASTGGGATPTSIYYSVRNHLLVMNKNYPISDPFHRLFRDLSIIDLSLAYVLLSSKVDRTERIRALWGGIKDFYLKRLGERG